MSKYAQDGKQGPQKQAECDFRFVQRKSHRDEETIKEQWYHRRESETDTRRRDC